MTKKRTDQRRISEMPVDNIEVSPGGFGVQNQLSMNNVSCFFAEKNNLHFVEIENNENAAGLGTEMYVGLKGDCSPDKFYTNPFKKELSLTLEGDVSFSGEITKDVAESCNFFLPRGSKSRCIPHTLISKYFNDSLWLSRFLANYEFNKKLFQEIK